MRKSYRPSLAARLGLAWQGRAGRGPRLHFVGKMRVFLPPARWGLVFGSWSALGEVSLWLTQIRDLFVDMRREHRGDLVSSLDAKLRGDQRTDPGRPI